MKPSHSFLIICACAIVPVRAQQAGTVSAMRDVVGEAQLRAIYQKATLPMAKVLPMAELKEDPTKVNQPEDLLSKSDIISYNGMTTLVPKRAIIQLPESMAQRVGRPDGSRIVSWAEFHAANRGWITTLEVSRAQAAGREPFSKETSETLSKATTMVVATFNGGTISVLPPKAPVPPAVGTPTPAR